MLQFVEDVHPVSLVWGALAGTAEGRIVLLCFRNADGTEMLLGLTASEANHLVDTTRETLYAMCKERDLSDD